MARATRRGIHQRRLQALEYTNVGGLSLPTRATLNTFAPQLGDPGPRVVPKFTYEIVATNLTTRLLHTGGFKPELPGKTYVNDMRFSTPHNDLHVNYYANDERWLTDGEVKQLPEYAVAAAQAGQMRTASSRPAARVSRLVVWVVLGVLAAFPIAIFFKQKRGTPP